MKKKNLTFREKKEMADAKESKLARKARRSKIGQAGMATTAILLLGAAALNGVGQRGNQEVAKMYGQEAPEQGYVSNVLDGAGYVAEKMRAYFFD